MVHTLLIFFKRRSSGNGAPSQYSQQGNRIRMKVIAINGSPHEHGNTAHALQIAGNQLQQQGIGFSIVHVGNRPVRGCMACGTCCRNKDERCSITSDLVNDTVQLMKEADGLIISSPVYFSGVAGTMKSFLDRAFMVAGCSGGLFRQKVGASVVAVRRTGGSSTFDCLNHYLQYSEMMLATSNYWNIVHGRAAGEMLQDAEGVQTMEVLGRNMAWLLQMRQNSAPTVPRPEAVAKIFTSFIR